MAPDKSGEFRGKTIEAAISNGLAVLGLARNQVEIEVIRPGSRGLLGIGAEDAVVRLSALGGGTRVEAPVRAEPRPEPQKTPAETAPAPRPDEREAREPRETREPRPAARGEPRQPARPSRAVAPPRPEAPLFEADDEDDEDEAGEPVPGRGGDSLERGREVLTQLLDYMNLRAQVEIVPQSEIEAAGGERGMVLNVVGDDLGILIGRQSEVLSALQFLTRLMVNQTSRGRTSLVVDVNGYKAKRTDSLRKLALRTADQVMQTGRTMALEPMPAAERRVIHLTLRNHPNVATQSVGEGVKRKVTVVPKKSQ